MMQPDLVTEADARHRARQLLSRPAYRRLWLARTISQVGDVAQFTTLALLLIALTGSGLGVSGAVLAEIAPVLLLAPLAGSLVDRLPRVRVMVAADLARVLLPAVLSVWHDNVAVAYAVASGCRRDRSSSARLRSPCWRPPSRTMSLSRPTAASGPRR